jgi:ribosomal protein L37E
MSKFCQCPRCGNQSFENLESYGHCVSCLFFEDRYFGIERLHFEAKKAAANMMAELAYPEPEAIENNSEEMAS